MTRLQLHLVDGTYELFRSHFGAPAREAPDGTPVGAVAGRAEVMSVFEPAPW